MAPAKALRAAIEPRWNSLDAFEPGTTALLHYTDMSRQPWLYRNHPLGHLWMRELLSAVERGVVGTGEIEAQVRKGHVRPSLLPQVELGLEEGRLLPRKHVRLDDGFVAPHGVVPPRRERPWTLAGETLSAYGRRLRRSTPVAGIERRLREKLE